MENTSFWERYTTPSIFKRVLLIVFTFIQFYPTKFTFLPLPLRHILSILGMGWIVFDALKTIASGKKLYVKKQFLYLLVPLLVFTIFSAFTLSYNGTSDPMYLYYFITSFLMLSSGYFTVRMMHVFYEDKLSFEIIAYYCIMAVVFQLAFGFVSYVNKPLVMPLLLNTEEGILQLKSADTGRFIGLGQYFMNLGVANGFGLLLIGVLLKNAVTYGISLRVRFLLTFYFILVAVLGNMQARTTSICTIIVIAYLIFSTVKFNFKSLKAGLGQIVLTVFILILLVGFIVHYWGDQLEKYNDAIDYGFELFLSAESGKGATTQSSEMLKWMLTIWPETTKTWLIGDGQYFVDGGGYYMRTDVGYARLLFYFGIFGMLNFFIYQLMVTLTALRNTTKGWKSIWFYVYVTILIINIKSCVDYTFYVSLFFSYNILYNKKEQAIEDQILEPELSLKHMNLI